MSGVDPNGLLGKAEDEHLEFKETDVLRRPANVAREVVGFLNAQGGEVWIGVKEARGKAVELQTIPNVETARRALLDSLIDVIEPQFSPTEVDVSCVGGLIRVSVLKKGQDPPYAVRDGGRRFMVRIADRLREMSREEIARDFAAGATTEESSKQALADTKRKLREAQQSEAVAKDQLWLRLVPTESLKIDFTDEATQEQFRRWLTDPTATGNRRSGWIFANSQTRPLILEDHIQHGGEGDFRRTLIKEDGEVTFVANLATLLRTERSISNSPDETHPLQPYALIEFPVSIFRLMAEILRQQDKILPSLRVVGGLVIKGIKDWTLAPGSLIDPFSSQRRKPFPEDVLEIDPGRLVFDADRLRESPDRCGFRLVSLIYGRFGFESGTIPCEFDQKQGRLILD